MIVTIHKTIKKVQFCDTYKSVLNNNDNKYYTEVFLGESLYKSFV